MSKVIHFRNSIQVALFECELKGQISDGMWENAKPWGHHREWCDAEVYANPNRLGVNFYARKSNYDFCNSALLKIIGYRMVWIANLAETGKFTIAEIRAFYDYTPIDSTHGYWIEKEKKCNEIFGSYEQLRILREGGTYDMKKLRTELRDMKLIINQRFDR